MVGGWGGPPKAVYKKIKRLWGTMKKITENTKKIKSRKSVWTRPRYELGRRVALSTHRAAPSPTVRVIKKEEDNRLFRDTGILDPFWTREGGTAS